LLRHDVNATYSQFTRHNSTVELSHVWRCELAINGANYIYIASFSRLLRTISGIFMCRGAVKKLQSSQQALRNSRNRSIYRWRR